MDLLVVASVSEFWNRENKDFHYPKKKRAKIYSSRPRRRVAWINWKCNKCGTSNTPQRRRDDLGNKKALCNKCGLSLEKLIRKLKKESIVNVEDFNPPKTRSQNKMKISYILN